MHSHVLWLRCHVIYMRYARTIYARTGIGHALICSIYILLKYICIWKCFALLWCIYIYIYFAYNISFIRIVNNRIHLLVLPLICIIYALKCVMLCIYVYKSHIDEYYIHKCMYNACKLHENVLLGGLLHVWCMNFRVLLNTLNK